MDEELGANIISITDEDGVEYEMEILDEVEMDGSLYYCLVNAEPAEDSETEEVVILKLVEEDGEEVLVTPDSDEEAERAFELFMDKMYDEDDTGEDE